MALLAPFRELQLAAAIRTGEGDLLLLNDLFLHHRRLRDLRHRVGITLLGNFVFERLVEDLGDRIGAGEDFLLAETERLVAADADQLLDDIARRDAGPQAKRDQPADRFVEGALAAARFSHRRERFERKPLLVLVDRQVEVAAGGPLPGRCSDHHLRTGTGRDHLQRLIRMKNMLIGGDRRFRFLGLPLLRLPDIHHLIGTGAVAVDGDPLAAELKGQEIRLLHLFRRRV